ncbi:MAG: multidrug transporter permease [Aeromicrobium sp.]|nr:multidrug transporter permease [Aeromicrobium sp.]
MRNILPIADARDTARFALRALITQRRELVSAIVTMTISGACVFAGPWALGRLIDDLRGGDSRVWTWAAVIAVAGVFGGIAEGAATVLVARVTEPALGTIREEVIQSALELPVSRIEEAGQGDLLSRVGDDIALVSRAVSQVVPTLVYSLVNILAGVTGILLLDWRLALLGLVAGPFYLQSLRWYLPKSSPYYTRERVAQGERSEVLMSGIYGARTLRAYRQGGEHLERIDQRSAAARDISIARFRLIGRFFGRINRAEYVGMTVVLSLGFVFVRGDSLTVGAATAAALYFHKMFAPIGGLMFQFDTAQSAGASLARIAGVILAPKPGGLTEPTASDTTLSIDAITHTYGTREVLHGVTMTLRPGERVALVGQTGAGKTTLAAIAAGILEPTGGSIHVGDLDLATLDSTAVRRHIVLLSQEVHVFSGPLAEDLRMVRPDATEAELLAALDTVGADWLSTLDQGLDTAVGDGAHALTPMQAQHVALARLVLADPPIAILDEATAEAGSTGARELEEAALSATAGRTALIVAHRLTQAANADRVIVLDDGRIIEDGPHAELLEAGGHYADLWAAWSTE